MQIDLFNVKEFVEINHLKEVTSPVLFQRGDVPDPNGLVSTSINFPKSIDHVVFVRGSGIDSSVKPCCVQQIRMFRQYIWVKGKYMVARLKESDFI